MLDVELHKHIEDVKKSTDECWELFCKCSFGEIFSDMSIIASILARFLNGITKIEFKTNKDKNQCLRKIRKELIELIDEKLGKYK